MARPAFNTTAYRNSNELVVLGTTLLLVFLVIALTSAATFCASGFFIILVGMLAASSSRAHHRALMEQAYPVTPADAPQLSELVDGCARRLQPGPVQAFVVPSRELNAYTFGLDDPKVVVLYSSLLKVMDADELRFIVGHELGHVRLGHTCLNSLVGGLAGIPASGAASALLTMAFLSWNRACEYSADRAGLLACGKPEKAVTALVKLVAGPKGLTSNGLAQAYQQIDAQDDTWKGNVSEMLGSHPLLIRRIEALRGYAAGNEYRRLQAAVTKNDLA